MELSELNPRKQIVYAPHWQAIRVSMLGRWIAPSRQSAEQNLERLEAYMQVDLEDANRPWRVFNYMDAIKRSFGTPLTLIDIDPVILSAVMSMSDLSLATFRECERKGLHLKMVTSEIVQHEWKELDQKTQKLIVNDLKKRFKGHSTEPRLELRWFLKEIGELR